MARILIVEDEDHVRVLAESVLQDGGHQTVSAARLTKLSPFLKVAKRLISSSRISGFNPICRPG